MRYAPIEFQTNKLLLCEGKKKKTIATQVIKEDLVQKVDVLALGDAADTGGIGSLAANLEGLPGITGCRNIKSIGLFLGNDSNPKKAFSNVKSVRKTN